HPENATPFGPQFASKIICAIEKMPAVPTTRFLWGGLLHNSLAYQTDRISIGGNEALVTGRTVRSHHSVPNYDRRLSIICDLAETLSEPDSSFSEEQVLGHLARKDIWVV